MKKRAWSEVEQDEFAAGLVQIVRLQQDHFDFRVRHNRRQVGLGSLLLVRF